jgi:hypothetical protein
VAAVWCVYGGAVIALAGAAFLVRPAHVLRMTNRWRAAALLALGLGLTLIGFRLPAPERRVAAVDTQLDEFVPVYQFDEVHAVHIDAPPDRVYAALKAVTAGEIRLFRTLTWIRRFGRAGPESILNAPERLPILDVATRAGFVLLADVPAREIVVGTIVIAPPAPRIERTPAAFKSLHRAGFAKAGMNFLLHPEHGGTRLTTATRVVATDADAARRFATYWRVIYPGSALIRRMWLRAVKHRAERATAAG